MVNEAQINGKKIVKFTSQQIAKALVNGIDQPDEEVQSTSVNWRQFLVIDEPEDVFPLLVFGRAPIWTPYNHSLLIGKKKSRKTLFVCWMISQYSANIETDILLADTEQGLKHVWKTRDRIFRLTGKKIHVLSLRGLSIDERKNVIEHAIAEGCFKVLVIDGIRDLLSNINDPDQCTNLVIWIEHLTVTYGLHIVNILHQNKNDNNARGHIGSELLNKAEITIELELDEKANCTVVKCESSRDIPFESFAFTHNDEGLPEVVSMPSKGKTMTESERKNRLQFVFDGEHLKRGDLVKNIMSHFEVGENRAGNLLAEFVRIGWIVKNGKDHHPDTVYKLMVAN